MFESEDLSEDLMDTLAGFVPVGEVSADERHRMSFGRAGVRRDDRYAVAVNADGAILLTPLDSIHRRELLVWQDERVRAALAHGLEQSAGGDVIGAGDFSRFADDEIDAAAAEA